MAQVIINNGDSGLGVRDALNAMYSELYAALVLPLKLPGVNANTTQLIPPNTWLEGIFIYKTAGNPTIRIGTIPNGQDILPDSQPANLVPEVVQQYFPTQTSLYISISGGSVNIRFDLKNNFF